MHACLLMAQFMTASMVLLQVAAGRSACVFDQSTYRALRRYDSGAVREMLHSPRVEGTRDGRLLFIGNADGALQAFDLRYT